MSYIISLIFGLVLGLVNGKTIKGLIYGKVELSKGMPRAYQTVPGYENTNKETIQGFRARFLGAALLLLTLFIGGLFWQAMSLSHPLSVNFADLHFYLQVLLVLVGIYLSIKLVKRSTISTK